MYAQTQTRGNELNLVRGKGKGNEYERKIMFCDWSSWGMDSRIVWRLEQCHDNVAFVYGR